jgi:hypothetical protein
LANVKIFFFVGFFDLIFKMEFKIVSSKFEIGCPMKKSAKICRVNRPLEELADLWTVPSRISAIWIRVSGTSILADLSSHW